MWNMQPQTLTEQLRTWTQHNKSRQIAWTQKAETQQHMNKHGNNITT
jgi:hypothetical protein